MNIQVTPSMPCDEALAAWFSEHQNYVRGQTPRTYKQYVRMLSRFFKKLPLKNVYIGHIREYQKFRQQTCGAAQINAELTVLQMTLKEAGLWKRLLPLYRPLPVPHKKVRQNMSEEEESRLLAVAFKKPRRRLAGHCLIVMANTSMGFGELRHVRRQDVYLNEEPPFVEVNGGAKNQYRIRTIPLNALALRSMRWIVARWEKLGGTEPAQYVLPHNARRSPEERSGRSHGPKSPPIFDEPMNHIYKAARGVLDDAGLSHLDPYDMRSHAITKLLANPSVSDQVYTEIVGHVGDAMKRRYSKQRMDTKKAAVDGMCKDHMQLDEPSETDVSPAEEGDSYIEAIPGQYRTSLRPRKSQAAEKPSLTQQTPAVPAPRPQETVFSQPSPFGGGGFYVTSRSW